MEIKQHVASLMPTFERSRVIEDIESQRETFNTVLADRLKKAGQLLRGQPMLDPGNKNFEALFHKAFANQSHANYFDGLYVILSTVDANLKYLERQVPLLFAKDITKETLSYRTGAIIQLLEASNFVLDYATAHVNYVLASETAARGGPALGDQFAAPQLDYLSRNQSSYLKALDVLYVKEQQFAGMLDNIPEITIDPQRVDLVRQTMGAKIDPFRLGLISAQLNPIYHLRMAFAEFQVKRYNKRRAEAQMLQLRVLALEEALRNKQDAQLQSKLEYNSGRLKVVLGDLEDMETRYLKTA